MIFTPHYDPSPSSREVVATSMSSFCRFCNCQKGLRHWSSAYPASRINHSQMLHRVTSGKLASWKIQGFTLFRLPYQRYQHSINLHNSHSAALPPMTVGTRMCLSVVLLVNKFYYWLSGFKRTTYVVKPSFIVQEK